MCLVVAGVYYVPQALPDIGGSWYYIAQAAWSLLCIILVLWISKCKVAYSIAIIEAVSILLPGITHGVELALPQFLDSYYGFIKTLASMEALILFLGAPWSGIINGFGILRGSGSHWSKVRTRGLAHRRNDNQVSP